ncbi:short-chain collagen C4-like [Mizuhopecten yessoensis]|uniref:short-chain collagen C4-like n=1 Tax=Mizuhopecten yessoensis TaxID=6573 RepID=UPI000B45B40C|nr:short-chain collagen C4-like [Mizuhopecten yessoensis]
MAGQTVIAGIVCLFVLTLASEKRILLNDPAYVSQQLTHLQSELQELRVKAENQEQTVSTFQLTVSTLQQTVNNQQQNISSQQQTISTLEQTVSNQHSVLTNIPQESGKGVVYTRWGRKSCPKNSDTQLVYYGYVGGSNYHDQGGAANALCMPSDPIWGPYKNTHLRTQAYLFGAEYADTTIFGMPNLDEDVPCAVCRNTAYSIITMIPGRNICYPGWTEAYRGILTAGYPADPSATQYQCTDEHPEATAGGGSRNDPGISVFAVWSKCGSLACPPYEDNKALSCVVCMI